MDDDHVTSIHDPRATDVHGQVTATRGSGQPADPHATAPVIRGEPHHLSVTAGTPFTDTVAATRNPTDDAPPRDPPAADPDPADIPEPDDPREEEKAEPVADRPLDD